MSYHVYKEYLSAYYEELNENRTYAVAFFSQHMGSINLVHARSKLEAINSVLNTSLHAEEEVEGYCAASDCWVHALQINNTLTE